MLFLKEIRQAELTALLQNHHSGGPKRAFVNSNLLRHHGQMIRTNKFAGTRFVELPLDLQIILNLKSHSVLLDELGGGGAEDKRIANGESN